MCKHMGYFDGCLECAKDEWETQYTFDSMHLLSCLVRDSDKLDQLLYEIDKVARDECSMEYGLPLHDEGHKARFREIFYRWAAT